MAARPQATPWLFGPWPDLLFGCGLLYALAFGVFLLAGEQIRTAQPDLLFPLLILVLGVPHYGATLLRVYERRRERRAYVVFSVWATLAILALFLASLRLPVLATFLVTLYLTWSPWHYTGQNYGIAVMFVRRAGVPLPPTVKRLLYASFALSYLLTFVSMHAGEGTAWDPAGAGGSSVSFLALGIPEAFARPAIAVLLAVDLLLVVASGVALARQSSVRRVAPALLLMLTQALWFTIPFGVGYLGLHTGLAALDRQQEIRNYLLLVALAHGTQYLWVTAYYAKQRTGEWSGFVSFYGRTLLAGVALWTLPVVLFAPLRTGGMGYEGGLALLLASVINLHHFVLDGAIWKLKGRIAEVLIRSGSDVEEQRPRPRRRLGLRHAVWAACALALVVQVAKLVDEDIYQRSFERGDLRAARAASERLAWAGFDRGSVHLALGQALLRDGRPAEARNELWRSLELAPTAQAHLALGRSYERERLWARAAASYEAAIAAGLSPRDEVETLGLAASAWLAARRPAEALRLLERAPPDDPRVRELFERARRESAAPAS
jgi:tetratricopeptide (TPR) repeat protein